MARADDKNCRDQIKIRRVRLNVRKPYRRYARVRALTGQARDPPPRATYPLAGPPNEPKQW